MLTFLSTGKIFKDYITGTRNYNHKARAASGRYYHAKNIQPRRTTCSCEKIFPPFKFKYGSNPFSSKTNLPKIVITQKETR